MKTTIPPQRTVAILDILGFRNAVQSRPLVELAEIYERCIAVMEEMNLMTGRVSKEKSLFPSHAPDTPLCQKYIFSDSIILVSEDESAVSALKLLVYAWRLSQALITFKMPLRGGVVYGELYSNLQRNICIGRALTAAYDLEKAQDWIGIAIDSSVGNAFPEILSRDIRYRGLLDDIFLRYPVPMKSKENLEMNTLNWRFNLVVEKGTRSLFATEGPPDVMQKVKNTLSYAQAVVSSGRIYVENQDKLPNELRTMWVGGKEPPFKHGDDL